MGRVYVPRFPYECLGWVSFFSCQLLTSSLPNWASGVGSFRWGCWCMGRGPVLRETCLGLRYITVSYTNMRVVCFWDVVPCYERRALVLGTLQ